MRLNDKAIKGVKFIKCAEIKRKEVYVEKISMPAAKEPVYNEVVLGGGQNRPTKKEKDNLEDESDRDNTGRITPTKTHIMKN